MGALRWLPKSTSPGEVERIFDDLLADDPTTLYRGVANLDAKHWPALLEALKRCTDVEAKLLLAAPEKSRDEVAKFVALIAPPSNCPAVAKKVLENPLARSKPVLAACAEVMGQGYPPFRVAVAGPFAALAAYGDAKQVKALLAQRPADDDLMWVRAVAKRVPKDRAAPFLALLEGRTETPRLRADLERYRRRFAAKEEPKVAPANRVKAPEDALARVYAAPLEEQPRAVVADFLLEKGEPLGELIQLQLARSKRKRGSVNREKELFNAHGTKLWPDHPVGIAGAHLFFEDVERGFPARFANAPVPTAAVLERLKRHPGWSTIRLFRAWSPDVNLVELFPEQMPLLATLLDLNLDSLHTIRERDWPVEEVSLTSESAASAVGPFPGLRHLKRLEVVTRVELGTAIGKLETTGLLGRIEGLHVRVNDASLEAMLAGLNRLPPNVTSLSSSGWPYPATALTRSGGAISATVEVESAGLESALEQLQALDPHRLASLELVLSTNGFFTKKTRPVAEAAARKVLARFPKATLSSVHPR